MKSRSKLAIFDTFKTKKGDLTGEANRQRSIIAILAGNTNAVERTRTGISQKIAKRHGTTWKNIYSGIFRDLDEILLPMNIAEEDGRLPLKRGPRALQEKGIPFYRLTRTGILIAISLSEISNRKDLLKQFFSDSESDEREFEQILSSLVKTCPTFAHSIFEKYVKAFCENKIEELLPLDLVKLHEIPDESLVIQREIFSGFAKMSKQEMDEAAAFLDKICPE